MTQLDADLVRRKLATIGRNVDDLASIAPLSLSEYRSDRLRRKATERLLQETVEAAVDINFHLLRALGAHTPPDYYESFVRLGERGPIPEELAHRLAPSAGLRNRIVHEYDVIDEAIVLEAVADAVEQFPEYVAAIESYLAGRDL